MEVEEIVDPLSFRHFGGFDTFPFRVGRQRKHPRAGKMIFVADSMREGQLRFYERFDLPETNLSSVGACLPGKPCNSPEGSSTRIPTLENTYVVGRSNPRSIP